MRFVIFGFLFLAFNVSAVAQVIDYTVPAGYDKSVTQGDYQQIVDLSLSIISKKYKVDSVWQGTVILEKEKGQDQQSFNLHNLVTKCVVSNEKLKWREIIQQHFDDLFMSIDEQDKIDHQNFKSLRKFLSVRVYPKEFILQRGGAMNFIVRTELEGTYTTLMLDLPGAFIPVQRKTFNHWYKDIEDVFNQAQNNVDHKEVLKVKQPVDFGFTKGDVTVINSEDYAASYILDLGANSPELVGELGSVISVPNKGTASVYKITKNRPYDFEKFVLKTRGAVQQSYKQHPQPVSDQFYWYYKSKFYRINVTTDANGKVNVVTPITLATLINKLNK